jgi:transposase
VGGDAGPESRGTLDECAGGGAGAARDGGDGHDAYRVVFHPLFAALARHHGFKAIPLPPGYSEGKGKVENPFKYVYSDLLKGSSFHDLADLNCKAEVWLRDTARVRKHGTTQLPAIISPRIL